MSKIWLILSREYITRVKKKSFLIMTLLTPALMAGIFVVPVYLAKNSDDTFKIGLVNETGINFVSSEKVLYENLQFSFSEAKENFKDLDYYALLFVPATVAENGKGVVLFAEQDVSLTLKERIASRLEDEIYQLKLRQAGIHQSTLDSLKTKVVIHSIKSTVDGEQTSSAEISTILGFVGAILIYFFIFLYGMQVLRGVMEEKMNRIVEVIISSVKPFELMMGKILGVALVGLTQFVLWVLLTFIISTAAFQMLGMEGVGQTGENSGMLMGPGNGNAVNHAIAQSSEPEMIALLGNIPVVYLLGCFLFYFLGGYLMYSALFAAIGAAIDHDADAQQFMLPVTIPLILAFIIAQTVVVTNPHSSLAFWFSIIPFTSPVVMMVRIPFGVPAWELIVSMVLMVAGFLFTTWLAAKIYRTGILMYGKKVTYRELAKWLFYKG